MKKLSYFSLALEAMRQNRNTNKTIKALQNLTDAELADIGINRGMINQVARGVVDIHRAVRDE